MFGDCSSVVEIPHEASLSAYFIGGAEYNTFFQEPCGDSPGNSIKDESGRNRRVTTDSPLNTA